MTPIRLTAPLLIKPPEGFVHAEEESVVSLPDPVSLRGDWCSCFGPNERLDLTRLLRSTQHCLQFVATPTARDWINVATTAFISTQRVQACNHYALARSLNIARDRTGCVLRNSQTWP